MQSEITVNKPLYEQIRECYDESLVIIQELKEETRGAVNN